jgi:pimeloyl-ACP methyl ester carboxylesterase
MKALQSEARQVVLPDGSTLTYHCAGRGLPVLLCNGLGAPREVWRTLALQLGDRYRFLSWDYRGLTDEEGRPAAISVHGCANDARAILEAEDISRVSVVGWSLGVQVALELFRAAPSCIASLVLVSGGARVAWAEGVGSLLGNVLGTAVSVMQRAPALVGVALRTALRAPEAFTWARRLGIVGDQVSADMFSKVSRGFLRVDPTALVESLGRAGEYDGSDVLASIDVPTLVIGGDRDPFTPRSEMERLVHDIPGAEYFLLPGATHYVLLDQAERVNLRIEKFWNERGYRVDVRVSVSPGPAV